MKTFRKFCLVFALLIISSLSVTLFSGCSSSGKHMDAVSLAFEKFDQITAVEMVMSVVVTGTHENRTETSTVDAHLIVIADETDEQGFYAINTFQNANLISTERSYYINGFAFYDTANRQYDTATCQYVEEVNLSDIENMDTDISTLVNVSEINKLKPKVTYDGAKKYTVSLNNVPLDKIIKDTQGLEIGDGNYTLNIWINQQTDMLEKLDYTAAFVIENVAFEMYMVIEIVAINDLVTLNIPYTVIRDIEKVRNPNILSVTDDNYRYTANIHSKEFIVYDKNTAEIVYSESLPYEPYCIDASDGIAAIGFGTGQYVDWFANSDAKYFTYYNTSTWEKQTVESENPTIRSVDNIIVYDNKIYYSNQNQHSTLYVYDISSQTHKYISTNYNATYYLNREDGILYVGARSSSNNELTYISLKTNTQLFQSGFSTLGSYTFSSVYYDGEYVYYAGKEFDKFSGRKIN